MRPTLRTTLRPNLNPYSYFIQSLALGRSTAGGFTLALALALTLALALALALVSTASPLSAQSPPCRPCAGVRTADPYSVATALSQLPPIPESGTLYVSWPVDVDAIDETALNVSDLVSQLGNAQAVAWPQAILRTPSPITANVNQLDAALEKVAALSGSLGDRGHVQVSWIPSSGLVSPVELAFLIKRASAAITGANSNVRVIVGPLESTTSFLTAFFAEDPGPYIDGLTVVPTSNLAATLEALNTLMPGTPVVIDSRELDPTVGSNQQPSALAHAASDAALGAAVTMFSADSAETASIAPLALLAREFGGDISLDPYSTPLGNETAWTFVRGEDLSLRVIAGSDASHPDPLTLRFADPMVRDPQRISADSDQVQSIFGTRDADRVLEVSIERPNEPWVLRLDRLTASEAEGLEGLEESLTVTTERLIPVSEILRRLQAFDDAQRRNLNHYSARNTTHLRFGGGDESLEATFAGDFFFRREHGWDWAWQEFLINGVRWRSKKIPEIPLVEPEKAAALPLEINFTKEYEYRLRGTEQVQGRDCWVVEFEPWVVDDTENPYRGTVWIDRENFFRVKSRALQLGLSGDVISNEETAFFAPLSAQGSPADWGNAAFVMPTRTVAQQVFNYLNANTLVEKETLLSELSINGVEFEQRYATTLASDATMVRDTEQGMRYLIPDEETGERVVQEEFDTSRLFALGGVFYDESLDFPVPLGGVNWIDFDFRDSGQQVNVFFAGVLALANWSDPSFLGSEFTAAADLFVLGIKGSDELYRNGLEIPGEEIRTQTGSLSLELGHDLGQRGRAVLDYRIANRGFDRADATGADFTLPADHLEHQLALRTRYDRSGFRLSSGIAAHNRTDWQAWGTADQVAAFDANTDSFLTYEFTVGKTFHLPKFQKFYSELQYVGGSDLDRFSKYNFGYFSDIRVRGYRSGLVRAEEASAIHFGYGFDLAEIIQLQLRGDAAWATDQASGLDNELLGGVGIQGNFVGPWNTIIRLDLGKAVAGPDDGVSVFLAVLKLFG